MGHHVQRYAGACVAELACVQRYAGACVGRVHSITSLKWIGCVDRDTLSSCAIAQEALYRGDEHLRVRWLGHEHSIVAGALN